MSALKFLLMVLGVGLFGSASALVVYDIFLAAQLRRLLRRNTTDESGVEFRPRVSRELPRKGFILRVNFLRGHAAQGLR
jgi:hypothetical protein